MPAVAGKAFQIFARDRGVKLDQRLAAFDRRVGTAGYDRSGLDKTLPRVRAGEPLDSEPAGREMQIANRVRSLHRWNNSQFLETWDVRGIHDLRMLNAP